jgi:hypothetical protein
MVGAVMRLQPMVIRDTTHPQTTDRQTGRQANRQTDRQADRQTDREIGRQANRHTVVVGVQMVAAVVRLQPMVHGDTEDIVDHLCYSGVTVVLQRCYSGLTVIV